MSKKIKLLSSVLFSTTLFAQQDTVQGKPLEQLVVTANKIEQKQPSTGKVITVITPEQIARSAGKTISQVLNEQAGITIAGAHNTMGAVQTVFTRGANAGRTLILLDGVAVNDPSTITGDYDLNLISINDVERIEVCRGAESTLYGSDAVAGVINIITLKNDVKKPFNLKLTTTAGSFNTYKANLQLFGKTGGFSYQARYAKLKTNGFSSAWDSAGNKEFDKDGYNGDVVQLTTAYQFNQQLSTKIFFVNSTYKADIDAAAFTDERDYTIHNKSLIAGTGFTWKNDIVTITGVYQFNEQKRNYLNDSFFVAGFSKFERNQFEARSQFAELYAAIKLAKGFTLLQGADFRYGSMNNNYLSISSFGPYTSSFKDTALSQSSMYASLLYNSKKLNIELGGRLNVHSRYGSNYTYTFNPSFAINKQLRAFASISTGFKAPSLYQLYAAGAGNRNLLPEKSTNYQLGLQYTVNKFSNRLVYFNRSINNGIDYNYISFRYFNFIKQDVSGLEYELNWQPTKKLQISANYTWLKAAENTQSRVTFKDTTYEALLRRPAHNLNTEISYQFTTKLLLSISGKYVSERIDVGGYKVADIALKGYFLLNAYAQYTVDNKLKAFVQAQNITHQQFFDLRGYNAMPFAFTTGITFNW
jgi:vitamin B12 transporter